MGSVCHRLKCPQLRGTRWNKLSRETACCPRVGGIWRIKACHLNRTEKRVGPSLVNKQTWIVRTSENCFSLCLILRMHWMSQDSSLTVTSSYCHNQCLHLTIIAVAVKVWISWKGLVVRKRQTTFYSLLYKLTFALYKLMFWPDACRDSMSDHSSLPHKEKEPSINSVHITCPFFICQSQL